MADEMHMGFTPFESYMIADKSSRRPSGTAVAGLVLGTVSVPWGAAAAPAVTAGEAYASPANLRDCCSITNACSIVGSFNLATAAAASTDGSKSSK